LILRNADALEDHIRHETQPWAQHYIVCGRALAAHGKKPTKETAEELILEDFSSLLLDSSSRER